MLSKLFCHTGFFFNAFQILLISRKSMYQSNQRIGGLLAVSKIYCSIKSIFHAS